MRITVVLLLTIALAGCATTTTAPARRSAGDSLRGALDGVWKPIKAEMAGRALDVATMKDFRLEVSGDAFTVIDRSKREAGRFVSIGGEPAGLDVISESGPNRGQVLPAIFRRTVTSLQLCYDLSGNARPTEFRTQTGTQLFCILYSSER